MPVKGIAVIGGGNGAITTAGDLADWFEALLGAEKSHLQPVQKAFEELAGSH